MGYYYETTPTGEPLVDAIGAAIDNAGHAYHHTSDWNEKDGDGRSVVDHINAALRNCADEIARLRAVQDAREAVVRCAVEWHRKREHARQTKPWTAERMDAIHAMTAALEPLDDALRHLATLTATEGT